jgi:LacI family transcriptional regulator
MSKVRIKDIAEIANVSVGTVDRVIHKRGEVSARTRERIERLLEEFNYKPDIAARSLALKREIHLAVMMPKVPDGHSFWEMPRQGIEQAIENLGHTQLFLHHFYFDQEDPVGFVDMVADFPFGLVEGLLFAPVFKEESQAFLERCASEQLPVVLFNSFVAASSVKSFVGQDARRSGCVAARLMSYGLPAGGDLAIINMSARKDNYSHIVEREKGFRSFFANLDWYRGRLIGTDLNGAHEGQLGKKLEELFSAHDIGGLFVTNSRVHEVAAKLEEGRHTGIRLVGYDLLHENVRYLKKGLIDFLISQKPEEQAFRGLNSLYNMVLFNRGADAKQWLPIDIITRENLPYYQTKKYLNGTAGISIA